MTITSERISELKELAGNPCRFCHGGWLDNRYGQDVECVNGVLIDIDVATEGWQRDVAYPVAPCHPSYAAQAKGDDFDNDTQERLAAWAGATP